MNSNTWLTQAQQQLEQAGIGTARLDSLVLLEDVLSVDRAHLLADYDTEISTGQVAKLTKLLNRRQNHEPLAYVRGKTEFYGREFVINQNVLEPRPESETMIDLLKGLPGLPTQPRIADVGAGSGALGITALLEMPSSRVELLEIDKKACTAAKINVDKFTLPIDVIRSDILTAATSAYDVLLCNLPYVPDSHTINQAALHEPKLAIFGGRDGLDIYRKLFKQLQNAQKRPLFILTESLPPQQTVLAAIARESGYRLVKTDDFIQVFAPQK